MRISSCCKTFLEFTCLNNITGSGNSVLEKHLIEKGRRIVLRLPKREETNVSSLEKGWIKTTSKLFSGMFDYNPYEYLIQAKAL
jgi:hypothetical protein